MFINDCWSIIMYIVIPYNLLIVTMSGVLNMTEKWVVIDTPKDEGDYFTLVYS